MSALERALRSGERFGDLSQAFVAGERFREFAMEPRRVGRLTVKSNRIAVVDPFGLGFGFQALSRKVPRGRFPVEVAVAHYRKGPRKGEQRVALARIRLGKGKATGYRLADVPDQPQRRWLGAKFGGYAVESGFGAFACGGAAKALDLACGAAFDEGELDHPQSRMLREQLTDPDAQARGWGSGELVPVMREGSLVAFTAGHGEGFYPSYWGYDDERRLVSLVTDFLVLPTDPELIRASWAGRTWRELHYDGDRGQRFWRVKVKGRVRTIEHGHVGRRGQSNEKQFTTSEAALEAAAKGIHRQLDAGYFELSSSASDLRHAMSGVSPKLAAKGAKAAKRPTRGRAKARAPEVSLETETAESEAPRRRAERKAERKATTLVEEKKVKKRARATTLVEEKKVNQRAKPPQQKSPTKKSSPKKSPTKKSSPKKSSTKKSSTKKSSTKKSSTKKSSPQKSSPKKSSTKKSSPQKSSTKKSSTEKSSTKKSSTKKSSPQKSSPKKSSTRKPSARLAKLKAKAPAARPRRW